MSIRKTTKKKIRKICISKYYDLNEMIEYFRKNIKPRPNLDVVKWMEKNGR